MNRIKELREKNGMSIDQLSKKLKEKGVSISPASISKYEREERNPKIDKWIHLADFFSVSVPYLQGINGHESFDDIFNDLDKVKNGKTTEITNSEHNKKLFKEMFNEYPYNMIEDLKILDKAFSSIDFVIPNHNGRKSSYLDFMISKTNNPYELSNIVQAMKQFYRIYVNALIGNDKAKKDREILEKSLSKIQNVPLNNIKKDTRARVKYPYNKGI